MSTKSPLLALPGMVEERARVEAGLRASVTTSDEYLNEIALHLIVAGGKRLRPVVALAAAQVGRSGPVSDEVVSGAIACELVHLGSLYHDDVMDESATRRGVETVNAKWGNLQAIVSGDFLMARASEIAASLSSEVSRILARTIGRLCEGQIAEVQRTYDRERTVASYLDSIQGKTASLFAASARIGALVAGHEPTVVDAVALAADAYGMVFQIVDDVLDLTASAEDLGKPAGHDLEEGVYTLPVLLTLAEQSPASRHLASLLGSPLTGDSLREALEIVRSGRGVRKALDVATDYARLAKEAYTLLPASPAAEAFAAAPHTLIEALPATR